jgi:hypothetical protein
MTSFTFVFMFFSIHDDAENFNEEDQRLKKLRESLFDTKKFEQINIVIVKTAFVNIGQSTTRTFKTSICWLLPSSNEGKNYEEGQEIVLGNINIGEGDTLGMIFNFISYKFQATKIIVYSNNHSSHFGNLQPDIAHFDTVKFNNILSNIKTDDGRPLLDFLIRRPHQELPLIDMLTHNELSSAIKNGFVGPLNRKIDLLVLVGCYSSSIDNVVLYHETVNYLFAAEGLTFFDVIKPNKLIEYVVENESVDLAMKKLFENFETDWKDVQFRSENMLSILTVMDLSSASYFINILNELLRFIINHKKILLYLRKDISLKMNFPFSDTSNILDKNSVQHREDAAATNCVDFIYFVRTLRDFRDLRKADRDKLVQLANSAELAVKNMINQLYLDETINKVSGSRRPFYGVSCFLPLVDINKELRHLNPKIFEPMAKSYSPFSVNCNLFAKKTLWPELIQAIYKVEG